ncbi:MAG TPA: O-antigen ligase family protein [Pyrinomonadaceae bacterium]|nr:O-antigen ligase family protein [Pyrinomonadaceae bacterium]
MFTYVKKAMDPLWAIGILWPTVLLVPYLPGPPRPSLGGLAWRQEIVLALLVTLTLAFLIKRSSPIRARFTNDAYRTAIVVTGALFALWITASVLWAPNPYSATHLAFQWGAYLTFFLLIRMVAKRPRLLRASLFALGFVVCLLGISCLIESLTGAALTDQSLRQNAKPLFRGFSGFSETMAVASMIFFGLALEVRKNRMAGLCGLIALVAWLATVQALERAPILGAAAGLLLLTVGSLAMPRCRPRNRRRTGVLAFAFLSITALQVAPLASLYSNSPTPPTALQRFQATSLTESNTSVRLLFWATGWEMFRRHPLLGVGANNYEVAFPLARAQFAALHKNSPLTELNEQLLTQYAHNEYVQILAELGAVGFLLFLLFCVALIVTFWRALRRARRPLLALGAGSGLLAFAVSSGASAFSFRWLGSGLIFFFAAALVSHFASTNRPQSVDVPSRSLAIRTMSTSFTFAFRSLVGALAFSVLMLLWASSQASHSVMHALAERNRSPADAERQYLMSLRFNPFDAATHYDYGSLLYQQKRPGEAISHLRHAVAYGVNTSTSYAFLAAAEEASGDLNAAERTLAFAAGVYPRSVFLLVRHAVALERLGRREESDIEFSAAILLNSRAARGWYQLMQYDIDEAFKAARRDSGIAIPGDLLPENAVHMILKENERRLNISPTSGWRGRMRATDN